MDWNYDQLEQQLATLNAAITAAEAHAMACGLLVAANNAPEQCLEAFKEALDTQGPVSGLQDFAVELLDQCAEALDSQEITWEPLLPDDETDMVTRATELGLWVQGFLFGISSGQFQLVSALESDEAKELVKDFTEIAKVGHMDAEEADEVHEEAYAELVEYVRIGALYISELVAEHIVHTLNTKSAETTH